MLLGHGVAAALQHCQAAALTPLATCHRRPHFNPAPNMAAPSLFAAARRCAPATLAPSPLAAAWAPLLQRLNALAGGAAGLSSSSCAAAAAGSSSGSGGSAGPDTFTAALQQKAEEELRQMAVKQGQPHVAEENEAAADEAGQQPQQQVGMEGGGGQGRKGGAALRGSSLRGRHLQLPPGGDSCSCPSPTGPVSGTSPPPTLRTCLPDQLPPCLPPSAAGRAAASARQTRVWRLQGAGADAILALWGQRLGGERALHRLLG